MAQYLRYKGDSRPVGVADCFTSLDNEPFSRSSLTLELQNILGLNYAKVRVWFAGNGIGSYRINSAYFDQDPVFVPITVNGALSFEVPAFGRWSDYVSTTALDLEFGLDFVTVARQNIPMLYRITDGVQSSDSYPGTAMLVDQEVDPETSYLILNFEGADGSTDFVDEAQDLTGTYSSNIAIYTTKRKVGQSSLRILWGARDFGYNAIPNMGAANEFSLTFRYLYSDVLRENTEYLEIDLYDYTANKAYIQYRIWGPTVTDGPTGTITAKVWNTDNTKIYDESYAYTIKPANTWQKVEIRVSENTVKFIFNDEIIATSSTGTIADIDSLWIYSNLVEHTTTMYAYIDSLRIDNMGQPEPVIDTYEVVSTATITISDNSQVVASDTVTINIGTAPVVYTFVANPTGAPNEIIIGVDDDATAANIAEVVNLTDGAIFVAAVSDNIVTVAAYTHQTVTISEDSSGVSVSAVAQRVDYLSTKPLESIPAYTCSGSAVDHGALGDDYGIGTLPRMTGSGTAVGTGNIGDAFAPAFIGYGWSHAEYQLLADDSFGISESHIVNMGYLIADGFTAFEDQYVSFGYIVQESLGSVDAIYEAIGKVIIEILIANDVIVNSVKVNHPIEDGIFAYDTTISASYYPFTIEESVECTEGLRESVVDLVQESLTAEDGVTPVIFLILLVNDTVKGEDTASGIKAGTLMLAEVMLLTDLSSGGPFYVHLIEEELSAVDDYPTAFYYADTVDESLVTEDISEGVRFFAHIIAELLASADTAIPSRHTTFTVEESVHAEDDVGFGRFYILLAEEEIAFVDGEVSFLSTSERIAETLKFESGVIRNVIFNGVAAESLIFADVNSLAHIMIIEEGLTIDDVELTRWVYNVLIESGLDIAEAFD